MHRAGLSPSSVCRRVSALKSFVRYLEEHEQFPQGDIARLRASARDRALPIFLCRGELLSLRVSDVDLQAKVLRVTNGEGRKSRAIPLVQVNYTGEFPQETGPNSARPRPPFPGRVY